MKINTIYNEDCLEGMKNMSNNSVTMTLTDIPYGVVSRKSNGLRNLDKCKADILTFDLNTFVDEVCRISSGSIYIFCGTEQVSAIRARMVHNKMSTRLCVWQKSNPSPMNGDKIWLSGIECCVYGKHPKATFNEHCKNTVWRFPCGRGKVHPTEKPLKLFEYLVSVSSNKDDIVFDPCIGSGTTAIACMNTQRNFIGFEMDKGYYDIACKRIEDHKEETNDLPAEN